MIQKNDLIKKFELLTKQEMANHNKAIEQYHQQLKEVREKIRENDDFHSQRIGNIESLVQSNRSLIENFNASWIDFQRKINLQVDEQNASIEESFEEINALWNFANQLQICIANLEEKYSILESSHKNLCRKNEELGLSFEDKISEKQQYSHEKIKDHKEETLKSFQNIEDKFHSQTKEINISKQDIECLRQNFSNLLDEIFILEKKVEHLLEFKRRVKGDKT